ncbi:MAG: PQQ-dependent sugar dehydrogenase [Acidobacteriota bacterium]
MPGESLPRRAVLPALAAAFLLLVSVAASQLSRGPGAGSAARRRSSAPVVTLVPVTSGLGPITAITNAGDARLFVTLQNGRVRILTGGQALPVPFLDVSALVSCCGERGLLSVAFHPSYAQNRFFFVDYTNTAGDTVIARYQTLASDPNRADAGSAVTLLTIAQPFPNHNGGQLQFGPDGFLYIGMGDGGSADDPMCNAQRGESLLGKLLRIDVDQNVNSPPFYGIPAENPFAEPGGVRDEIWAIGLRNPWRFSFDRLTGDLWIGDVGQNQREEIDFQPCCHGGQNYGWKMTEGTRCGDGGTSGCPAGVPACNAPELVAPTYEYTHAEGCSVTGGYVYRGSLVPALAGRYVYGDFCSGRLWANGEQLDPVVPQLTTFGEDIAGEVYLGTQDGKVLRFFDPNAPTPTPTPAATPARTLVLPPRRAVTPRVLDRAR